MALKRSFPLPIQQAIELVPSFITSILKSRPGCVRAMRPERQDSLEKMLPVMLCGCSLQHDGAICVINGGWVRPKTIDEMAANADISKASAVRVLSDLRAMGYIESKQIKRKNPVNGQLEVSPGLRFFTKKFWQELGLWDLFQKSMKWAKKNCRRKFLLPFKGICAKIKDTVKSARAVLQPVISALDADSQRIKSNCETILTMLRKKE